MNEVSFAALSQLLGSYLHQDWTEEFSDATMALQSMVASEPRETIDAARAEIVYLLSIPMPEAALAEVLRDHIGCYFDPAPSGSTTGQWLQEVAQVLSTRP